MITKIHKAHQRIVREKKCNDYDEIFDMLGKPNTDISKKSQEKQCQNN